MKNAVFLLLVLFGLAARPAAGQTVSVSVDSVLILSDLHFAPVSYYQSDAEDDLLDRLLKPLQDAPVDQWSQLLAATYGPYADPSYYGSPASNALLLATLDAMAQRCPTPRRIIITGDFLGHNLTAFAATPARAIVLQKIYQYIASQLKTRFPGVVVLTCLGNNDTDRGKKYETNPPSQDFLQQYADTWAPLLYLSPADEAKFKQEFVGTDKASGMGHYAYKLPGSDNTMLLINSMLCWSKLSNPLTSAHLSWLKDKLEATTGEVWLGMHVPPGAEVYGTTAAGSADGCPGSAQMMWDPEAAARFFEITDAHAASIKLMLAGHTHMDEFRLHLAGDSLPLKPVSYVHVAPSIGLRSKNNPGFQVLRYDANSLQVRDFRTCYAEGCSTSPAGFCWSSPQEYSFNQTYRQVPPLTAASLGSLQATMASNLLLGQSFATRYGVSSQAVTNRALSYYWYYWCGISARTGAEYKDCICNKGQVAALTEQARGLAMRPAKAKSRTKAARGSR